MSLKVNSLVNYPSLPEKAAATYAEAPKKNDPVAHPSHYTQGGVECIDAIRASMSPTEYRGYLKGNAMKYLWRYDKKNGAEDLKKAQVYLSWLIDELVRAEEGEA